jgi:hypothetical protein
VAINPGKKLKQLRRARRRTKARKRKAKKGTPRWHRLKRALGKINRAIRKWRKRWQEWQDKRGVFRKNEPVQRAHVYAERIADKFNLIITDGWRPPNVSYGARYSLHKRGMAYDFIPARSGYWGVLDRAKAWARFKFSRKFQEVLWRVPGHNIGDNPHLHLAFAWGAAKPSRRVY